jgi:hypothetical protein
MVLVLYLKTAKLRIRDPDFCLSRIPDLKTGTKGKGEKNFFILPFFCCHKYHKIINYFIFEQVKKKLWASVQRIIKLSTQKIVKALKDMGLGSGIYDLGKTYSGSRIPDPGAIKARIPDPQHWKIGRVNSSSVALSMFPFLGIHC